MAAKTYRKIALVTAEQFLPAIGQIPNGVYASVLGDPKSHPLSQWVLDTKEGQHTLRGGDYICTGPAGEQWNVAQEIFEATYEEASALATPSTDLREENERLENEAVLRKAAYDGVGSLLLEVQQDCIAEHNRATTAEARITELDEEIACLNAELATINFDLEDLKELADLREHSKQMAESGQDDAEARAEAAGTIVTAQAARIAELEAEVMELRRALGLSETLSKAVHKQAVEAENLVEKVHAENAEAKREARILAQSMWQQSYSDVTGWQMLDDTAGIITQISNMSAGIRDRAATLSAENTALKERLEGAWLPIEKADREITHQQTFPEIGLTLRNSDQYWVRDADGRVFEASWTEDGKGRDYWWDWEGESPVDPVEFMPHPLSALAREGIKL